MITKQHFQIFIEETAAILNRPITYLDQSETWCMIGEHEFELTRGGIVLKARRYILRQLDSRQAAESILLTEADRRPVAPRRG